MTAHKGRRTAGRAALVAVTVLLLILLAAYGVMWILVHGPSPTARRLFVLSVRETSAGGFLANLYLSEAEIEAILAADAADLSYAEMDSSLVSIPKQKKKAAATTAPAAGTAETAPAPGTTDAAGAGAQTEPPPPEDEDDGDGIEVVDVSGSTYNGKLMIVSDPTRVFVGVPDSFGANSSGLTVAQMIRKYECTAGTNAGGFYDPGGQGTGGIPDGIVIYDGELLWGETYVAYDLAGIDGDGLLHVGTMTGKQALEAGIRYAASYGPALVINGQSTAGEYGFGGGLNPRTAIGQRADGAMLLLVINGRAIDSLGATLNDLADIMLEHGAVNATNLDGGSSSIMIMHDEYLTNSAYIFGERVVATAILVR